MISAFPFSGAFADASDPTPSYYLYETGSGKKGLLCSIPLIGVTQDTILGHEQIYEHRAEALVRDFFNSHMQHNPILLITQKQEFNSLLEEMYKQATLAFEQSVPNQPPHFLWKVTGDWQVHFQEPLCIADGHHRFSALMKYYKMRQEESTFPKVMAAIFSSDQVKTRSKAVVVNTAGLDFEVLMQRLDQFFEIHPLLQPKNPDCTHDFSMVFDGSWYNLCLRPVFAHSRECQNLLGIEILKKFVLQPALNEEGYSYSSNVKVLFETCNITALLKHVQNRTSVGFITASDSSENVMNIAKQGRLLEANSTYFEPKMLNGMISLKL